MKLPVLFSAAPLSLYTWMTPPEDVGDTLLAERTKGKPRKSKRRSIDEKAKQKTKKVSLEGRKKRSGNRIQRLPLRSTQKQDAFFPLLYI